MNNDLSAQLQSAVPPGEEVLWHGAPKKGIRFQVGDVFMTVFGLFFLVVSSMFVVSLFPWGLLLPHFWIGVYFAFGRYFVSAKTRSSTEYVLTEKRVIIAKKWPRSQIRSVTLAADQQTTLTTHSDGTSSVTFGTVVPGYQRTGTTTRRITGDPTFEFLEKPFEVMQIVESRWPAALPIPVRTTPMGLPLPADGYQPIPLHPAPLPWTPLESDRPQ